MPDWITDPDVDRPDPDHDDDISLPDWWPDNDRPELPDLPGKPDKPGGIFDKLQDILDKISLLPDGILDIIGAGGDFIEILDIIGDILIDKLPGSIGGAIGKILKKIASYLGIAKMILNIIQKIIGIGGSAIDLSEGSPWPSILSRLCDDGKKNQIVYDKEVWEEDNGWQFLHKFIDPRSARITRLLQCRFNGIYLECTNGKTKGVGRTHQLLMKDFAPIYTAYDKTNSDINLDYRKIMRGYSLEWHQATRLGRHPLLDYLGGGLEEVVNLTPMAGLTVDDCVYIDTYRDHQFALEHIYADSETGEEDLEAFHKHIEEYWGIPREKHDEVAA